MGGTKLSPLAVFRTSWKVHLTWSLVWNKNKQTNEGVSVSSFPTTHFFFPTFLYVNCVRSIYQQIFYGLKPILEWFWKSQAPGMFESHDAQTDDASQIQRGKGRN